jgi:hypothetical protein
MLRNYLKEAIRRKRRSLLSSGVCLQRNDARSHTASHTVKQILDLKLGGVTPSAVFTRFGTQRLSLLLGPRRRCTWTSYQIRWGGKEGGARVADSATKRRLLPRNLYPPGTLEQAYRRRWGLHWTLTSLYRKYFCFKSLYICFFRFSYGWPLLVQRGKGTIYETPCNNGVIY